MPNSAAGQIWPNLPRGTPEPVQRSGSNESVAAAMWPRPQPKPPTNSDRESLLRGLRELNAKMDARLAREGKR